MGAVRIIAVGQPLAGDDGAGLAVFEALSRWPAVSGVELLRVAEPSELVPLLEGVAGAVVVDAAVDGRPGRVLELGPDQLGRCAFVSSHGFGVAEALRLAAALSPAEARADVRIVAVTISRPTRLCERLSPEVAQAVEPAAQLAVELATRLARTEGTQKGDRLLLSEK